MDVYLRIKENMKWNRTGRRPQKPVIKAISTHRHSDNEKEEEHDEGIFAMYK